MPTPPSRTLALGSELGAALAAAEGSAPAVALDASGVALRFMVLAVALAELSAAKLAELLADAEGALPTSVRLALLVGVD